MQNAEFQPRVAHNVGDTLVAPGEQIQIRDIAAGQPAPANRCRKPVPPDTLPAMHSPPGPAFPALKRPPCVAQDGPDGCIPSLRTIARGNTVANVGELRVRKNGQVFSLASSSVKSSKMSLGVRSA